jgi:hypothetical protein
MTQITTVRKDDFNHASQHTNNIDEINTVLTVELTNTFFIEA